MNKKLVKNLVVSVGLALLIAGSMYKYTQSMWWALFIYSFGGLVSFLVMEYLSTFEKKPKAIKNTKKNPD